MLQDYAPILIYLMVVLVLGATILGVSAGVGGRLRRSTDLTPYECGILPEGNARERFTVKFYLVAMLFILFDVEGIFFFPWAVIYKELGWFGFAEMVTYVFILLAGYIS
jgi:NADH-quinone oxidoreductase subunit A